MIQRPEGGNGFGILDEQKEGPGDKAQRETCRKGGRTKITGNCVCSQGVRGSNLGFKCNEKPSESFKQRNVMT